MRVEVVEVSTACVFHAYFRLHALFRFTDTKAAGAALAASVTPRLIVGSLWTDRKAQCRFVPARAAIELTLEALVDRTRFPDEAVLELACEGKMISLRIADLMAAAITASAYSLAGAFDSVIQQAAGSTAGGRPRLLDLGGRARSGLERRISYPQCDVTVFDILADPSVDVVGDAHELSKYVAPASFDFVLCVSVFEHILMPWKVALEINKILKLGGVALVHTHQTIGMHDLPWDFWRFSDTSWNGLFNAWTGFEITEASMQGFMCVVPQVWEPRFTGAEGSGGFEGSSVMVRKVSETRLAWDVPLAEVLASHYPSGRNG